MRTYVKPVRPGRFDREKRCEGHCGEVKPATAFHKVRGGGTTNVCKECMSRSMRATRAANRKRFDDPIEQGRMQGEREALYRAEAKDPERHREELEAIAKLAHENTDETNR